MANAKCRNTENYSDLQVARLTYAPAIPATLRGKQTVLESGMWYPSFLYGSIATASARAGAYVASQDNDFSTPEAAGSMTKFFPSLHNLKPVRIAENGSAGNGNLPPLKVGIVLSGGQAPGTPLAMPLTPLCKLESKHCQGDILRGMEITFK